MKRSIFMILLLQLFVMISLFPLNHYELERIYTINIGDKPGELGFNEQMLPGGVYLSPTTFKIKENDTIYIYDRVNARINIYTLNFEFIKKIKRKDFHFNNIQKIKFGENNNLVIIDANNLEKIDENGNVIYTINENYLPRTVFGTYNYFPYKEYVIYYDKYYNIKCFGSNGNELSDDEIKSVIDDMYNNDNSIIRKRSGLRGKIDIFLKENNLLLYNDKLIIRDTEKIRKYYNFIKTNIKGKEFKDKVNVNLIKVTKSLIEFDKNNNSYWKGYNNNKEVITVLNKYGEVLDCFEFRYSLNPTISPNGDVYGWEVKPDGVTFYKISRRWGMDQEKDEPVDIVEIKEIISSGYLVSPIKKYNYHPIKAFDNIEKTDWTEDSEGSGVGEYIGIILDEPISTDEIKIMHGSFSFKQTYERLNRLKKGTIVLDDKRYEIEFEDKMEAQGITFDTPVTFKEMKIIIQDVYKGIDKRDMTTISEIQFFINGKRIALDISKYEKYAK